MWYGKISEIDIWKEGSGSKGSLLRSQKKEIQCPGGTVVFYMGEQLLSADIDELNLSVRSFNCLKRAGWNTIGDILYNIDNWQDLLRVRNLGKLSAIEIMRTVKDYQAALLKSQGESVVIRRSVVKTDGDSGPKIDDKDLSEMDLTVRSYNCLRRAGYSKVGELRRDVINGMNLRSIRNLGVASEKEIVLKLELADLMNGGK